MYYETGYDTNMLHRVAELRKTADGESIGIRDRGFVEVKADDQRRKLVSIPLVYSPAGTEAAACEAELNKDTDIFQTPIRDSQNRRLSLSWEMLYF